METGSDPALSTAAYVAKGPVKGSLVVVEFRAVHKRHGDDSGHSDIGRLIDRNVKG